MFKRWKQFLSKQVQPAEESGLYRFAVTLLVMYALLLTLHQIEWPPYWWAVLLLTPAASYMSYRRRHRANIEIKIFLSFAMVGLLFWFMTRLAASVFDPRIPLAELLIWLQTLHAFDLPAKKDLRYTVLVALILMALAAVLTYSSWFALFVLGFCALFLVVVAIDFWSDNRLPGTEEARSGRSSGTTDYRIDAAWLSRTLLLALPTALVTAAVIFVFMPRFQGLTLRTMPLNWDLQFSLARVSNGAIVNRGLPESSGPVSGRPERIDGDSYFGFDSEVNLNARGRLSDRVVMKVRTSDWQYHRAVTFADYTGGGWRSGLDDPERKWIRDPPFYFPTAGDAKDRLTIYYAEVDLPNVVFTPQYPRSLYFPSTDLYIVDTFQRGKHLVNTPAVIVAPFALESGMVYSVLNRLPDVAPSDLKELEPLRPQDPRWRELTPYLQLPEALPSRVGAKAREVIGERQRPWEQASALSAYLQQNFEYNLDVPFYPEGVDTVDHFLFEAREGYCEQFASALAVMARSVGLPARYVTGYLPGTYNPLSGFYEIQARDAHAWVEIFIPGNGWTIFDPVPGGNPNPGLGEQQADGWLLESLFSYLEMPDWLHRVAGRVIRASIVLAVLALLLAARPSRDRRGSGRNIGSSLWPYLRKAEALVEPRLPGETVRTWAQRLQSQPLERIADVYEETYYQDRKLTTEGYQRLEAALKSLKASRSGARSALPNQGSVTAGTPDRAP